MKKVVHFSIALLSFFSTEIYSQTMVDDLKKGKYGTPEERAQKADDMMQKGLELTPEQQPKIKEINLRYAWRVENEVVKVKMSDWSRYNKISSIQKVKDKELKEILDKNQFSKYKKKRDEMFWAGMKAYFFKHKIKLIFVNL